MVDAAHEDKLTDKQEAFITAYLTTARFNAAEAARQAGYSEHSAKEQGYRLMQKARARIDEYLRATAMTAEEILAELTAVALAPTTHFMQVIQAEYTDEHGRKHPAVIRQDYGAKIKALELLGKAAGLFNQIDVNVRETKTIIGVSLEDVIAPPDTD
jgi:phage terminase small subunit